MIRGLILAFLLLVAGPAAAQTFPDLSGRVVDAANLLTPEQEAALDAKLAALQQGSTRQLVVATVPDLQGLSIEDYGYQLGRHWGIGQAGANNGVVLIVAPNDRRVRIEVGYGLEGILTDALSSRIINDAITPRFREGDFPGGINAGVDAIIAQLQAPPEVAEQRAAQAASAERRDHDEGSIWPLIFWIAVLCFILIPLLTHGLRGRGYRGRRGGLGPVVIWGPGTSTDSGWNRGSSSGGWSSGGSSWGGGGFSGGGFSGGGGSFGGGGASGGW